MNNLRYVKLTSDACLAMRRRYLEGAIYVELAREFGVSHGTVSQIITGRHHLVKGVDISRGRGRISPTMGGRIPDPGMDAICVQCNNPRMDHSGARYLGKCPGGSGLQAKRFRVYTKPERDGTVTSTERMQRFRLRREIERRAYSNAMQALIHRHKEEFNTLLEKATAEEWSVIGENRKG